MPVHRGPAGHAAGLERLTFLHWAYEPAAVQRLLPSGLQADLFDGAAWIGLVPFFMRVRTGAGIPWVSNFCETNVRTYVRDHEGRAGIWFLSLDAARAGAVAVARARLPAALLLVRDAARPGRPRVSYHCRPRLPARAATSRVRVASGSYRPGDVTHASIPDRPVGAVQRGLPPAVFARAEHRPWPLYRAQALGRSGTAWSPRPGCPRRGASRWCTTHLASTSGSACPSATASAAAGGARQRGAFVVTGDHKCTAFRAPGLAGHVSAVRRPRSAGPGPGRSTVSPAISAACGIGDS